MLIFAFAVFVAAFLMHEHYELYPGLLDRGTVQLMGRGKDYIALRWTACRNTEEYKVYFREHLAGRELNDSSTRGGVNIDDTWSEQSTGGPEIMIGNLNESSSYDFIIRPVNEHMEGKAIAALLFSTKKSQTIKVDKRITKLTCNKAFTIAADAQTDLEYESSDKSVADIDPKTGEIVLKGAGVTEIKVKAKESGAYVADSEVTELEVIESEPVSAGGAKAHVIYHVSPDNCEVVKTVTGADGASVPQALGYTGDKYIIAYGMSDTQRIVSFDVDGDGKEVSKPTVALGHPNGFTYADENGLCYSVRGWSARTVTYSPETDEYGSLNLTYGCSGIGYDRKEKLLYTSSRTAMVAYDISDGYSIKYRTGVVNHGGYLYTQDCGGHAGILLRCLSDSSKHGINYIDLYDMIHGNYLGSISCDLSEVESAIVNDDGFLEILANNAGNEDYIWRTNLNIETIGEGLPE